MKHRIMLLALAAVSAAVFALPSMALAEDEPLHLSPTPAGGTIDSKKETLALLSTTSGTTVKCNGFSGSATFDEGGTGTTGEIILTFGGDCTGPLGTTCTSTGEEAGSIETTALPFHLVTLPGSKPGVLITPGEGGHFATFKCSFLTVSVTGNGVIGTITEPACGETSDEATLVFEATAHGVQKHKTVAGTETEYSLQSGGNNAAQEAHGTLTLDEEAELDCT